MAGRPAASIWPVSESAYFDLITIEEHHFSKNRSFRNPLYYVDVVGFANPHFDIEIDGFSFCNHSNPTSLKTRQNRLFAMAKSGGRSYMSKLKEWSILFAISRGDSLNFPYIFCLPKLAKLHTLTFNRSTLRVQKYLRYFHFTHTRGARSARGAWGA